jgi:Na+-transporting methylmalonyl-CoA/oxaloacetate decarboxylase gamma subunit
MYLVAIAWFYVALMMAVAEAVHPSGSLLGAFFTLMLYGVGPIALVLYLLGTPMRAKARRQAERAAPATPSAAAVAQPDEAGHATGDPLAAERKEA